MRPSSGTTVARRKLRAWCRWAYRIAENHLRLLSAEVCKYAKMFVKHLDGTCGHWVCGTAHPFIERLNRGFSPVKRQAAAATSQIFTSCPTSPQAGAICLLPIEGGRNVERTERSIRAEQRSACYPLKEGGTLRNGGAR